MFVMYLIHMYHLHPPFFIQFYSILPSPSLSQLYCAPSRLGVSRCILSCLFESPSTLLRPVISHQLKFPPVLSRSAHIHFVPIYLCLSHRMDSLSVPSFSVFYPISYSPVLPRPPFSTNLISSNIISLCIVQSYSELPSCKNLQYILGHDAKMSTGLKKM